VFYLLKEVSLKICAYSSKDTNIKYIFHEKKTGALLYKNLNLNRFEVYTNIDLFDFNLCKEKLLIVDSDNFVSILFVLTLNHGLFSTRNWK